MQNFSKILMPAILVAATTVGCTTASTPKTQTSSTQAKTIANISSSPVPAEMISYDTDDQYQDWTSEHQNLIELKGNTASVGGTSAGVTGNKIMILSSGVFVISGKLDDGQIIVDSQNKGTVKLVLNGAEIHSKDGPAIWVKDADKTVIVLAAGTNNVVADGATYTSTGGGEDEPTAAIFSKDDLTINGAGSLSVQGAYKDGIASKDRLVITGGTIAVSAKDDALVGRDTVLVKDGKFTVQAGGDGIKTTNDTDAEKGFIALEGGSFDIKSGADGIQAESSVLISGGTFNLVTNGGSANGVVKVSEAKPGQRGPQQPQPQTQTKTDTSSAKGLKAGSDITISGGTFKFDTADDAINSKQSLTISKGDLTITAGDDAIHADAAIAIKGGKVNIVSSYEGIESTSITISGGETRITSNDDGINGSGDQPVLHIDGGYVAVTAGGDGIDINGAIYMTDGTVVVNGPTANDNGAVDYDATFEMTGGFLVAAGSAGMAQAPATTSTQHSVAMTFPATQAAGTLVSLQDSKGNPVVTFAPKKQYQSVVVASPALKKGETYTFYSGGTSSGTAVDGLYTGGAYQGGTKFAEFSISNMVSWVSDKGVSASNPNPGPGGGGRKRP